MDTGAASESYVMKLMGGERSTSQSVVEASTEDQTQWFDKKSEKKLYDQWLCKSINHSLTHSININTFLTSPY